MSRSAEVLISTANSERLRAWSEVLSSAGCRVRTLAGRADDVAAVDVAGLDVLVTDRPLSEAAALLNNPRLARGEVGLIAVGCDLPADVSLPADCSNRELRLACLLLSEIIRLRRQRQTHRRKEKVLSHLALSDPLTGLPNRRAWEQHLAERNGGAGERPPLCLALFDIDRFKPLNDTEGHLAGDECLKRVASQLTAAVRRGDFISRLGGDEFALLAEGVDASAAAGVIDRIRASLACETVTVSAGWAALSSGEAKTFDSLFQGADEALRKAKQAGRNCTRPS
jgi:diguanylate cyclase (GGDEF)-like protein